MKINITITKYVTDLEGAEQLFRQVYYRLIQIKDIHINAISNHNHRKPERISSGDIAEKVRSESPPTPEISWENYIKS